MIRDAIAYVAATMVAVLAGLASAMWVEWTQFAKDSEILSWLAAIVFVAGPAAMWWFVFVKVRDLLDGC